MGHFVAQTLFERDHSIRLIDSQQINGLPKQIEFIQSMVETDSVKQMVSGFEVVVNCLPGRIGHAVRAPLLSCQGMLVADLAFYIRRPKGTESISG